MNIKQIGRTLLKVIVGPTGLLTFLGEKSLVNRLVLATWILQIAIWATTMMSGTAEYLIPQYCLYQNLKAIIPSSTAAEKRNSQEAEFQEFRTLVWLATVPGSSGTILYYGYLIFALRSRSRRKPDSAQN